MEELRAAGKGEMALEVEPETKTTTKKSLRILEPFFLHYLFIPLS